VPTAPDTTTRLGGWLFRHRTSLPFPVALAILIIPAGDAWRSPAVVTAGVLVTAAGECIRLWGVHHIGVISRTRSDRLGPLIDTGPFALVRNPLYIGNILLWVGFALAARLVWLAPIALVLLALEYHAIVRWEESLLIDRMGEPYRDYLTRVGRWLPMTSNRGERGTRRARDSSAASAPPAISFSWGETLFSERGTLVAIVAGYALLWLKARS
jgi:protein-S-isoprenylcysteine O-methyltransferase Ste14